MVVNSQQTKAGQQSILGNPSPKVSDLQKDAGIDYLSPYFRMAGHNVHANPKGVFFKLGLIGETDVLLSGPSNAGLADPGHATALSLVHISSQLLHLRPTFDNQIAMTVMFALQDEIGDALIEAHRKLAVDDRQFRGGSSRRLRSSS